VKSQLLGFKLAAILFGLMALGQVGRCVIASQTVSSWHRSQLGKFFPLDNTPIFKTGCISQLLPRFRGSWRKWNKSNNSRPVTRTNSFPLGFARRVFQAASIKRFNLVLVKFG